MQTKFGISLGKHMEMQPGRRLNLRDTLRIGITAIKSLQLLHGLGYIHRNINPENFVLGLERDMADELKRGLKDIKLIGFGECQIYMSEDGEHLPDRTTELGA